MPTWTYALTNDIGKVRFEIGDTDITPTTDARFSDEEITYKLGEFVTVMLTAAALCDVLATKYAGSYTFKTDDQQFNRSDLTKQWAARAAELRARASGGVSVVPVTRVDAYSDDLDQREGSVSAIDRFLTGDLSDTP